MPASVLLLAAISPCVRKHAVTDSFTDLDSQQVPHANFEAQILTQASRDVHPCSPTLCELQALFVG